jgi:hypothetical protein
VAGRMETTLLLTGSPVEWLHVTRCQHRVGDRVGPTMLTWALDASQVCCFICTSMCGTMPTCEVEQSGRLCYLQGMRLTDTCVHEYGYVQWPWDEICWATHAIPL